MSNFSQISQRVLAVFSKTLRGGASPPVPARVNQYSIFTYMLDPIEAHNLFVLTAYLKKSATDFCPMAAFAISC